MVGRYKEESVRNSQLPHVHQLRKFHKFLANLKLSMKSENLRSLQAKLLSLASSIPRAYKKKRR